MSFILILVCRPIYNGLAREHSLFYYIYFIFAGFHLAFSIYAFLGIPETGSAGLLNTIQSFTETNAKIVGGALGVVVTVGFALQGVGNLWYYKQIWKHNNERKYTSLLICFRSQPLRGTHVCASTSRARFSRSQSLLHSGRPGLTMYSRRLRKGKVVLIDFCPQSLFLYVIYEVTTSFLYLHIRDCQELLQQIWFF